VLELDPRNAPALLELARLELEARAPARAAEYARRALAVDPDSVPGHVLAGRAAEDLGDLRGAVEQFRRARELDPRDSQAAFRLASALAVAGELEEARSLAEEALRLDPSSTGALLLLSKILYDPDEPARAREARELVDRALALDPGHAGANGFLAFLEQKAGNLDAAEQAFETSLARDPDDPETRNNFAYFLDATGRRAEAAQQYEELLRVHADSPIAVHAARGLAWIRATAAEDALRDGDAAVRWARFAREGAPEQDLALYLDVLAAAYAEARRFEEAIEAAEQALAASSTPAQQKGIAARLELYRGSRPFRRER
jgi:tetratricopeptide (TPR) repeat protein